MRIVIKLFKIERLFTLPTPGISMRGVADLTFAPVAYQVILEPDIGQFCEFESP